MERDELPPPFYDNAGAYMNRHGSTRYNERCSYCGKRGTKMFRGKPTCRMCRQMIIEGVKPRG